MLVSCGARHRQCGNVRLSKRRLQNTACAARLLLTCRSERRGHCQARRDHMTVPVSNMSCVTDHLAQMACMNPGPSSDMI